MTPWEQEAARRRALIQQMYYQELGRSEVDDAGMAYWMNEAQKLNNDQKLRSAIRFAGGVQGPTTNTADPMQDSTYAAFLRQMQFDETQIQSALDNARTQATNRITQQAPMYDRQREQAARNVNSNAEARGMFRSGGRLSGLAEARDSIDLNQRAFETNQRQGIADAEQSAADRIAELRRRRAEAELSARDRLTRASVQ